MTAGDFRRRYDGQAMLTHFREVLVLPHLNTLRRLRPLGKSAFGDTPVATSYH
jgi:hypothetical protein